MASIINSTTTAGVTVTGDNSGELQLATNNGTTAVTIDTSQNVLVNSTTLFDPNNYAPAGGKFLQVRATATDRGSFVNLIGGGGGANGYWLGGINYAVSGQTNPAATIFSYTGTTATSGILGFATSSDTTSAPTERMRIDSSGRVFSATTNTSPSINNVYGVVLNSNGDGNYAAGVAQFSANGSAAINLNRGSDDGQTMSFRRSGTQVGNIVVTTSTTAYNTSSDYRLKENIAPLTGALATVVALKPVTYKWKVDGSNGQGFIAHELQAVVPDCVTGEKDAVDEEGNPVHQGIDTSFLVATLTAAIQELKAELYAIKAEVQALKGTL